MSERAAAELRKAFGIRTVRDLATNQYVCIAQAINGFSKAPVRILDEEYLIDNFKVLTKTPIQVIPGISERNAALLKRTFGIGTIQEFAENKFVNVAQAIVAMASLFPNRPMIKSSIQLKKEVELLTISKEEAVTKIKSYIDEHPDCKTSDIIYDLGLDPDLVLSVLNELQKKGLIRGMPIE